MDKNVILLGDCLKVLKELPDESINCCVTSPPYYGLRDYGTGEWVGGDPNCPHRRTSKYSENTITGHKQIELQGNVGDAIYKTVCPLCGAVREDKQIGLEETPEEYVQKLVDIFHEVKRCLTKDGTLWLNIGDSYAHNTKEVLPQTIENTTERQPHYGVKVPDGCKPKDLIGIPWMLALALRKDGWYLRQDIIWHKPNPMPESVKDRFTKSHEYIFLLSKSEKYYFDHEAIQEKSAYVDNRLGKGRIGYNGKRVDDNTETGQNSFVTITGSRNKRDVWTVQPSHYKGAHFATYPEELIYPCIMAGCPEDGIVLDPFMGSGTTGVVAKKNHRNYLGIELNPKYKEIADNRIKNTAKKLF